MNRPDGDALPVAWIRFAALPAYAAVDRTPVDRMWTDQRFQDAVLLASPSLAREFDGEFENTDESARLSLRAYYSRMASRATPFGLFAGVFSGGLSAADAPVELDLSLVGHVRQEEAVVPKPSDRTATVKWRVNPSLERWGDGVLLRNGYLPASPRLARLSEAFRTPVTADEAMLALTADDEPDWLARDRLLEVVRERTAVDSFGEAADGHAIPAVLGSHALDLHRALSLRGPVVVDHCRPGRGLTHASHQLANVGPGL